MMKHVSEMKVIGNHVEKVKMWNPAIEFPKEKFDYIDLSSINKDNKQVEDEFVLQILGEDAPSRARQIIKENDILVSTVRPNLNGVAIVKTNYLRGTASTGYCVLRPKPTLFARYLYYWVQTEKFISELVNKASGASYPAVSDKIIKETKIPLPPLATQQMIAATLDAADAYRQQTKALIAKYDQLAQSLFLDMFGDPVRNEKGWVVERLDKITSKIGSGATPSGGKESYQDEGVSLIRSMNIYDNGFKYKDLAFLNEKQAEKLKNVTVEENDVLFNITGASVCRCCIVPPDILPARVNQHVSILRPKNKTLAPIFLSRLLVSENCKKRLLGIGTQGGATREAITKEQLEKFEIILPPIYLQNLFAERIQHIEAQKQQAQASLQKAEELFNSLLQRAFAP